MAKADVVLMPGENRQLAIRVPKRHPGTAVIELSAPGLPDGSRIDLSLERREIPSWFPVVVAKATVNRNSKIMLKGVGVEVSILWLQSQLAMNHRLAQSNPFLWEMAIRDGWKLTWCLCWWSRAWFTWIQRPGTLLLEPFRSSLGRKISQTYLLNRYWPKLARRSNSMDSDPVSTMSHPIRRQVGSFRRWNTAILTRCIRHLHWTACQSSTLPFRKRSVQLRGE